MATSFISRTAPLRFIAASTLTLGGFAYSVAADEEPAFDIDWYTIDCGGGEATDEQWNIEGTIAQTDAGMLVGEPTFGFNGEDLTFTLEGGFWPGANAPVACPADVTVDGTVNISDLMAVISTWGSTQPTLCDVANDGVVNIQDLLAVISAWGPCP